MSFNNFGKYICECGREFNSSQSFNGHKSHCTIHQMHRHGSLEFLELSDRNRTNSNHDTYNQVKVERENKRLENKIRNLEQWLSEKHQCERCGKVMTEYYGSGRFCSRFCANSISHSEETKKKISDGLNKSEAKTNYYLNKKLNNILKYDSNPDYCVICGARIDYENRGRKTCSDECLKILNHNNGVKASHKKCKRSKNEIAFCNLCEEYFGKENVLHNEPIFNGWDADIILPKFKIAVLWNGPWHYVKVTKSHKLLQTQNRDRLKAIEIEKCGYTLYIIKDDSKKEYNKVVNEFNLFLNKFNL